jgi:hypothetical protein
MIVGTAAAAGTMMRSHSGVFEFGTSNAIANAGADLTRTTNGVSFTLHTALPAGNAETVWWVIFNNPGGCESPAGPGLACGLGDVLALFDSGNNPAQIAILNADGRVVPPTGEVHFSGRLGIGDPGPGETLVPGGLTDPLHAEIHLVIDDHGAAASDHVTRWAQLHSLTDGCGPAGDQCIDAQDAAFAAPN